MLFVVCPPRLDHVIEVVAATLDFVLRALEDHLATFKVVHSVQLVVLVEGDEEAVVVTQ